MKKFILPACILVVFVFAGYSIESASTPATSYDELFIVSEENATPIPTKGPKGSDVIEIREKMFIAQTNEIYINVEDYRGKTIKYEGYFTSNEWEGQTYCYVVRDGPGCCPGVDNTAGFEVRWDNPYPEQNDWVEVVGTLEEYEEDGEKYLQIKLASLNVLDVRGADYVTQ